MGEGVSYMCKAMEERCKEVEKLKAIQFATKLINRGKDTFEEIAEVTELTLDEINELAAELSSSNA